MMRPEEGRSKTGAARAETVTLTCLALHQVLSGTIRGRNVKLLAVLTEFWGSHLCLAASFKFLC